MGILDNVKNFVTGGAAEVTLQLVNPVLGNDGVLKVKMTATPTGDTITPQKAYFIVKAEEISSTTNILFKHEEVLEKMIQINSGDTKEWSFEFEVPDNAPATFFGRHSSLQWSVAGYLDMSGKDPGSDWHKFVVNRPVTYDPVS